MKSFCFLVLVLITPWAHGSPRVIVVSDLHLKYANPQHVNEITFEQFLEYLKSQPQLTDVVVNGDIYDAPTVGNLTDDQRIEATVGIMLEVNAATAARVHFNFGNHDEHVKDRINYEIIGEYSERLAAAMRAAGVTVIGEYSKGWVDLKIGGVRMAISHIPFARTAATIRQSERLRWHARAHRKVNDDLPLITSFDGVMRIMSDSHTPLGDSALGVFNTGKLAIDGELPFEPKTFLAIDEHGVGQLQQIHEDGHVSALHRECMFHLF